MAAFSIAPAVSYSERDATLYTQSNVIVRNALVGKFPWGPINKGVDLDGGETELISTFFKPTNDLYLDHMIAIDYLNYSRALTVVRVEGAAARNAVSSSYGAAVLVENIDTFEANPSLVKAGCHFMGRYAGELGNSLMVSVSDYAGFNTWEYRNSIEFSPEPGEFCAVVVDTDGSVSGFSGAYGARVSYELEGTSTGASNFTYYGYGDVAYASGATALEILEAHSQVLPAGSNPFITQTQTARVAKETVTITLDALATKDSQIVNSTGSSATIQLTIDGVAKGQYVITDGSSPTVQAVLDALVANITATTPSLNPSLRLDSTGKVYTLVVERDDQDGSQPVATITYLPDDTVFAPVIDSVASAITQTSLQARYRLSYTSVSGVTPAAFIVDAGSDAGLTISNAVVEVQGSSGDVISGEVYGLMTMTQGSKKSDGSNAYFVEAVNKGSKFIYFVGDALEAGNYPLSGGVSDAENASRINGYEKLENTKLYRIKGIIDSCESIVESQKTVDVAVQRRDCVAIMAPSLDSILGSVGQEKENIISHFNSVGRFTSYQFMVDNWAYMYDRYNDTYRWVPCTGGTAGKRAYNIQNVGSWKAFSYYNRGKYSNYVKLAWSAEDEQRGDLYLNSVNSIIDEPGEGFVLMGTKTGLKRPSSFSRINVRDLFIMMEQDISATAKYFLGENNDTFTRGLFVTTVDPYLRNLKDQGALIDYRLKVDETNNNAQIVAENKFVAGIFIKAPSAIDWIWLDFAALRADMSFEEVEGAVGIAA